MFRVQLVAEARAEEEWVGAVLGAACKAVRVVGNPGALVPEEPQYAVRTAHVCVRRPRGKLPCALLYEYTYYLR